MKPLSARLKAICIAGALVVAVLAAFLVARSCLSPKRELHRRLLVKLPTTYRKGSLVVADDGNDYAYIVDTAAGQAVVHNGQMGPSFAQCTRLQFSPKARKLFYWASDLSTGTARIVLVADGQTIVTEFAIQGALVFSPDGLRWAAAGGMPELHEGEEIKRGAVMMLVDGREVGRHADESLPAFTPDGAHVAYLMEDQKGTIKLVIDGEERRTFDAPQERSSPPLKTLGVGPNMPRQFKLRYLSDGRLLMLVQDEQGWAIYRDLTRLGSYPYSAWGSAQGIRMSFGDEFKDAAAILPSSLIAAEKAPVAAWWERPAGEVEQWRVVRDGQPDGVVCARYFESFLPMLSDDGQRVAYPCPTMLEGVGEVTFAVIDGQRYGPYHDVWGITFSPDGRHIAYAAGDGSATRAWSYYVDGKASKLRYDQIWSPRFDVHGTRVAWEAQRGRHGVLCLNGDSLAAFDEILWGPKFWPTGELSWAIRRDRRVIRVDVISH